MKTLLLAAAMAATTLAGTGTALADDEGAQTLAVIGDWPYSQALLDNAHLLVNSVNADKSVKLFMHLGDLHSGSMPCTSAHIAYDYITKTGATLATSNPGWNVSVFNKFQHIERPVIYAVGDNEWADCHKAKQHKSGAPLKELAAVRELFFAKPGMSLGLREKRVQSQALAFDAAYPADSQFVENVMWEERGVVFATFNMPGGSNNDTDQWSSPFTDDAAQAGEAADRNAANLRWLAAAFAKAKEEHAKVVVIGLQADMWDLEAGAAHLSNYGPFVRALATLSLQFGRPVLLLNGDSHNFKVENPLADPTSTLGQIHGAPAVPNLTRIVVEGSGVGQHWLRLTIDPRSPQVFSWQNVAY